MGTESSVWIMEGSGDGGNGHTTKQIHPISLNCTLKVVKW
jgi:hypothetical protein